MEIERFCIWQDDRAMLQKMITGYNQYSTVIMESAGEMMNTKKDYGWIFGEKSIIRHFYYHYSDYMI